ncbi:hypothetical protein [Pseudomonas taiwanensis]|uniref:hypothetical protein n=1 Tax=Pseudomonas taiwanensis TaxID=470150 RepID=UPI0028E1C482|nr:hypothetical protein [Pseudomonas taiwanensis]
MMHQGEHIKRLILADKMPTFLSRVERINEKLKSGGLPIIKITHGDSTIRAIDVPGFGAARLPMVEIMITREATSLSAGAVQLLAKTTIDASLGTGALQHRTYGELTAEQRERVEHPANPAACDHCTSNRNRAYIFTLNTPGGVMRVGGGCMKDFMGFDMTRWAGALNDVIEEAEKLSQITFSEVNEHEVIPLRLFLGEAVKLVAEHGYQKRETGFPTGEMAFEICQALICDNVETESPEVKDRVSAVIDYIKDSEYREKDKHLDYFVNLRTMVNVGHLTLKQANLIASAVASLDRHQGALRKEEEHRGIAETFVGQPKDRLVLKNLKLHSVSPGSNMYGATTTFRMTDENGAYYQWKAAGIFDMEAGGTVNLIGTIKHERFYSGFYKKEICCNSLSRCQFLTPEEVLALESKKPRKKSAAPSVDKSPAP